MEEDKKLNLNWEEIDLNEEFKIISNLIKKINLNELDEKFNDKSFFVSTILGLLGFVLVDIDENDDMWVKELDEFNIKSNIMKQSKKK